MSTAVAEPTPTAPAPVTATAIPASLLPSSSSSSSFVQSPDPRSLALLTSTGHLATLSLNELRQLIDEADTQIVNLLNDRSKISTHIGHRKQQELISKGLTDLNKKSEVYVPSREKSVLEKVAKLNENERNAKAPMPTAAVQAVYREIMSASIALQRLITIAYLGPPATFTHQAARARFGFSLNYVPCATIHDVFATVEKGQADYGVVPLENSIEGSVSSTLDELANPCLTLKIYGETFMPVSYHLFSYYPLHKIHTVYSHPQILAQCRTWLYANLPKARWVEVPSASKAADICASTHKKLHPHKHPQGTPGKKIVNGVVIVEEPLVPLVLPGTVATSHQEKTAETGKGDDTALATAITTTASVITKQQSSSDSDSDTDVPHPPVTPTTTIHNVITNGNSHIITNPDEGIACLCGQLAEEMYGVPLVAESVQDGPAVYNMSRFVVLGRESETRSGDDKTLIVFKLRDRTGVLYEALAAFKENAVNLTKIESRPWPVPGNTNPVTPTSLTAAGVGVPTLSSLFGIGGGGGGSSSSSLWEYVFFVDCQGHETDRHIQAALSQLSKHCAMLRVLGSCPNMSKLA